MQNKDHQLPVDDPTDNGTSAMGVGHNSAGSHPTSTEHVDSATAAIPSTEEPYDTVVIGSGPVGLMAAASALKHRQEGKKVAIVADRVEELGVRQQVLWVQQDVFSFMEDLAGRELIWQYIENLSITEDPEEGYYITTGDFEQLFYDVLRVKYREGVDYDLIRSQKIGPRQRAADEIKFDLENRTILVQ